MPKTALKVYFDADLIAHVNAEAKRRRISVSQVLRALVLDDMRSPAKPRRSQK